MTKGIYCYLDIKQDEIVYIGKDSHINKNQRHKDHYKQCNYNIQKINQVLQNNLNRYKYCVLWTIDDCTDNHLNQMEIYYINKYNPKFNFTRGGEGITGMTHSLQTRNKISYVRKKKGVAKEEKNPMYRKHHSKETKDKISRAKKGQAPWNKGLKHKIETRKKISQSCTGRTPWNKGKVNVYSEETLKKISKSRKGSIPWNKGRKMSVEEKEKISNAMSNTTNTTGFYRVFKHNNKALKQGFCWRYQYFDNNKRKAISSIDLKKLEEKVRKEGLEWKIINKENSIKSIQENNNRFN